MASGKIGLNGYTTTVVQAKKQNFFSILSGFSRRDNQVLTIRSTSLKKLWKLQKKEEYKQENVQRFFN